MIMAADPVATNLIDSSFQLSSFTLGGDCADEAPRLVRWDRTLSQPTTTPLFFTDKHIRDVVNFSDYPGRKVALLIEPPSLNFNHYQLAFDLQDSFDVILTYNSAFFQMSPKILYYPLGGSWIREEDWRVYPKTRRVSLITSQKTGAAGHQLRHFIAETWPERLERFGRDYRPVDTKKLALASFRFSIVVESISMPGYFSEKLIDALACGTTPIYWGATDIRRWFPGPGIVTFDSTAQLAQILGQLDRYYFDNDVKQALLTQARALRCAEDRIFHHYSWIWDNVAEQRQRRSHYRKAFQRKV